MFGFVHSEAIEPMRYTLDDRSLPIASLSGVAEIFAAPAASEEPGARGGDPFSMNTCLGALRLSRIHGQPPAVRRGAGDRSTHAPHGTTRRIETPAHVGLVRHGARLIATGPIAAVVACPAAGRARGRYASGVPLGVDHSHGRWSSTAWPGSCRSSARRSRSRWALAMAAGEAAGVLA